MQVGVALYGAARVVIGQPWVEVAFDTPTIALGQVVEQLIAAIHVRARTCWMKAACFHPKSVFSSTRCAQTLMQRLRPCSMMGTGSPCWWLWLAEGEGISPPCALESTL